LKSSEVKFSAEEEHELKMQQRVAVKNSVFIMQAKKVLEKAEKEQIANPSSSSLHNALKRIKVSFDDSPRFVSFSLS